MIQGTWSEALMFHNKHTVYLNGVLLRGGLGEKRQCGYWGGPDTIHGRGNGHIFGQVLSILKTGNPPCARGWTQEMRYPKDRIIPPLCPPACGLRGKPQMTARRSEHFLGPSWGWQSVSPGSSHPCVCPQSDHCQSQSKEVTFVKWSVQ